MAEDTRGDTTAEGATPFEKTKDARPQPEPPHDLPDKIGSFVVVRRVGAGGMGVVYAARDPLLDREVAIKVLRPSLAAADPTRKARMLREAQALAKLSHENVITVYQAGIAGDQIFIVMELVVGETLGSWLLRRHSPDKIVPAFAAAGRGLAAVHRAGLVHRDFKPENVLVGDDGRVRVTDFGLVGLVDGATPETPSADGTLSPLESRRVRSR